jgi:hypothetical protein
VNIIRNAITTGALRNLVWAGTRDVVEIFQWTPGSKSLTAVILPAHRLHVSTLIEYKSLALELEAYVLEYRKTLRKLEERTEFDRQWGLKVHRANRTIEWADVNFVAFRITEALHLKRLHIQKMSTLSPHAAAAHLLHLFTDDVLGRTAVRARVFKTKADGVFKRNTTVPSNVKGAVVCVLLLFNLFVVWFCAANGRDKGQRWQKAWLTSCVLKIFLDIVVVRFLQIIVLQFYVPEFCLKEVQQVKGILLKSAKEIVKPDHSYNLHTFSYSDYFCVSSFVSRAFPDLIESKLILMYRSPLPGELSYSPPSERVDWKRLTLQEALVQACVICILHFGAAPMAVQKMTIHAVPTIFLSIVASVIMQLRELDDTLFYVASSAFGALILYFLVVVTKPMRNTLFRPTKAEATYLDQKFSTVY